MIAEAFAFIGLIVLIIFVFAEFANHKIMGVMASLLLLILGVTAFVDGISFQYLDNTIGTTSSISSSTQTGNNTTSVTNKTINTTSTTGYQTFSVPFTDFTYGQLLGFGLILVGLYSSLYYGLNTFSVQGR